MPEEHQQYLIVSIHHTHSDCEHILFWREGCRGYTFSVDMAGRYSEDEARDICSPTMRCIAVPVGIAEKLALTTPYYKTKGGNLFRMYDPEHTRPVPNHIEQWREFMEARLNTGGAMAATPIKRPKAIYL